MENQKEIANNAEKEVIEILNSERAKDDYYDILYRGILIEVKEAKYLIIHHGHYDYGRFKITLQNHKELLEHNGYYFFVIRNSNRRYYYLSAKELEDKLKLLDRMAYNRYAGISTRWVSENCRLFNKEEFLKEIGKGDANGY